MKGCPIGKTLFFSLHHEFDESFSFFYFSVVKSCPNCNFWAKNGPKFKPGGQNLKVFFALEFLRKCWKKPEIRTKIMARSWFLGYISDEFGMRLDAIGGRTANMRVYGCLYGLFVSLTQYWPCV